MNIDLTIESNIDCGFKAKELESIACGILNKLGIKKPHTIIEVFLVSDKKIHDLNKKYRNHDEATDVLSFPQKQFPTQKEEILGTIFIAPKFAERGKINCNELFIHGILHLLGYDHETDNKNWRKVEEKTTKIIH